MARLNVNPTRMVLTSLKKRLKVAVKGHKMLKDKRDELMKQFLELARENKRLREQVEAQIGSIYSNFVIASAVMSSEVLNEALMYPKQGVSIEVGRKNVMSVDVPVFDFTTTTDDTSNIYPYGFANTSAELDNAIENLSGVFPEMLRLAAVEKEVQLLAAEIEKTRRRVNALEYVMIPQFQETIKYIQMKLDENERGNQTRLMKVKDLMVKAAIEEKQENTKAALEEYSSQF
ncbi:V-type sodium ATPase subunit D [bioreactor metagenome]|jgi:V/A-type H+-transporting ATPase subunit D|uniref:V-type ATP synthase subunit D n=2 Tax=root TaxID=1 RepID=A0A562J418_9FIRM|nr:V-type ATP synthase subunit D [Sedimentibacter saalensis]MEA5094908.1 V-type ATP synthase subunit D [Sedimentibacter saalensis]TWH77969.1 V/A-type H+-transporting ATPase subunit D [Sedimentibacter saalensis]